MTVRPACIVGILVVASLGLMVAVGRGNQADAQVPPVDLGSAASFAVLGGSTVTNTGPTVIGGDLGVSPGTAVTGFPPGVVTGGTIHSADTVAADAQADLTIAYDDAAGRAATAIVTGDLGGQVLGEGVYSGVTLAITGTVTLDAAGDANAVFIFQSDSTLDTASSSTVELINGADPCNVFWQVGSSATLGTDSALVGSVLALTSITANTGVTVDGRLLARNGAVTLDSNLVTAPDCTPEATTTTLPETTTTTAEETTTTTAEETTTTTAEETTTTTAEETTTTVPEESPPTVPEESTTTSPAGISPKLPGGPTTTVPGDVSTSTVPSDGSGGGGATGTDDTGRGTLADSGSGQLVPTAVAGVLAVTLGCLTLRVARRRAAGRRVVG